MRILVTGGRGWIGSHLVPALHADGNEVIAVDLADGDLAERGEAARMMLDYRPGTVVHLASSVGRVNCERDPQQTILDATVATTLVAKAAAGVGARLVYFSTSEVYGDTGGAPSKEDGPFGQRHNLYAAVKWWGEEAARLYAPDGLTIVRPTMPYGPGMPFDGDGRAAVMMFLRDSLAGDPITVHAGAARSWCYIDDMVEMLRRVVDGRLTGAWNVGRDDDERSMEDVARLACELAGGDESTIRLIDPPGNVTPVKRLDCAKLRRAIDYRPRTSLEDGLVASLASIRERMAVAV